MLSLSSTVVFSSTFQTSQTILIAFTDLWHFPQPFTRLRLFRLFSLSSTAVISSTFRYLRLFQFSMFLQKLIRHCHANSMMLPTPDPRNIYAGPNIGLRPYSQQQHYLGLHIAYLASAKTGWVLFLY